MTNDKLDVTVVEQMPAQKHWFSRGFLPRTVPSIFNFHVQVIGFGSEGEVGWVQLNVHWKQIEIIKIPNLRMRFSTIPQLYRHANRWAQILTVLSKYGLAGWIDRLGPRFARGILKDREGTALCNHSRETRIRLALSELGPTFIKLGQILSTRPDVIGVALANELSMLQDNTPADPFHVISPIIESELGEPLEKLFSEFEAVPLASASIGQVHRGTAERWRVGGCESSARGNRADHPP